MKYLISVICFVFALFLYQPVIGQVLDVSINDLSDVLASPSPDMRKGVESTSRERVSSDLSTTEGDGVSVINDDMIQRVESTIQDKAEGWKANVATIDITPTQSMWMAGYGARTSPSEGTLHPLWVKSLALEDAQGNKSILITADLLGWPKELSDDIRSDVKEKYGLSKSQIILNSSHTHSGPVLVHALVDVYPLDDAERKKVKDYTIILREKVVDLVGESLKNMVPVKLYSGNGVSRFQVNRRNNTEATQERINDMNGPNDYAVPVIKVERADKSLMAIVFGYACHATVLGLNKWSGDYPGFAQIELEKDHPGTVAMFFQGAGADQNPIPRRTIPLARQYGRTLAATVDRVLEEDMKQLDPILATAYTEVDLDLNLPPSVKELTQFCESASGYQKRWGERKLKEAKEGKKFMESYPFPLQVWKLGNQSLFVLGGETLIGYTIRLKEMFGYDAFVMGYSNDVMTYIPTARVLQEGGYEGATSQMVYGLPSTWSYNIESTIIQGMVDLAKSIGLSPLENKLISN